MKVPFLDLKAQYRFLKPEIDQAISQVLDSGNFILGEQVSKFEQEMGEYCGSRYAVGVGSGSDALFLSLLAVGVGPEDLVITTPFTFFATAGAIVRVGARPLFVDIDPKTYNLDPTKLEELIQSGVRSQESKVKSQESGVKSQKSKVGGRRNSDRGRLKVVIPVHLYGQCAEMAPIIRICRGRGIKIIEDVAQAIGAEYKGRRTGSLGDLGCFSFFPTKNLGGYGDGGMVITGSKIYTERIRRLRVHGAKKKNIHTEVGINSRLDELQAAILRVKLKYLNRWTAQRQEGAEHYNLLINRYGLAGLGIIRPYQVNEINRHIYNLYVIRTPRRDELRQYLKKKGISTGVYYPVPLHLQRSLKYLGYKAGDLPEAERASQETIALPLYPEITPEQQEYVIKQIRSFFTT